MNINETNAQSPQKIMGQTTKKASDHNGFADLLHTPNDAALGKNHVISNVVKDLLNQAQSHVEEIPRFTRDDVPLLRQRHYPHTPIQQSSGDEYYWQHQNQLQQSCLHFSSQDHSQPYQSPEIQQTIAKQNEIIESHQTDHLATSPAPFKPPIPIDQLITHINNDIEQKQAQHLNSRPNSYLLDNMPKQQENETLDAVQPLRQRPSTISQEFKNHHLFIKEQQAELTLQVDSLNPKALKELKELIKTQFKNKGLILQKLTINGVEHE